MIPEGNHARRAYELQSLVMTSSFTNLVLAARFRGLVGHPEHYQEICDQSGGSDLRSALS